MTHPEGGSPPIVIGNEFARVQLEIVPGPDGDQVRIFAVRTKRTRTLSAGSVEKLSRVPVSTYLDALETPFGPEPALAFGVGFPAVGDH